MVKILTPYEDALRYMDNAKEALKKAGKKDGEYADVKYVKSASGIAYSGVLLALDEYLKRKEGGRFEKPKSIDDYRIRVAKQNKKVRTWLNTTYSALHINGYYHGTTSFKIIKLGMEEAEKIIRLIK